MLSPWRGRRRSSSPAAVIKPSSLAAHVEFTCMRSLSLWQHWTSCMSTGHHQFLPDYRSTDAHITSLNYLLLKELLIPEHFSKQRSVVEVGHVVCHCCLPLKT